MWFASLRMKRNMPTRISQQLIKLFLYLSEFVVFFVVSFAHLKCHVQHVLRLKMWRMNDLCGNKFTQKVWYILLISLHSSKSNALFLISCFSRHVDEVEYLVHSSGDFLKKEVNNETEINISIRTQLINISMREFFNDFPSIMKREKKTRLERVDDKPNRGYKKSRECFSSQFIPLAKCSE